MSTNDSLFTEDANNDLLKMAVIDPSLSTPIADWVGCREDTCKEKSVVLSELDELPPQPPIRIEVSPRNIVYLWGVAISVNPFLIDRDKY
jgi:hypothetical protein